MDALKVIYTSFFSIAVLFISTKIIGNKQMSELNMFDYVNGITIGSIAAEAATNLEVDFYIPLISIVVYTIIICLTSLLGSKSLVLRRFFSGRSILLMDKGKIYNKNFNTAKLDISEFLTQCRINGYFNLDDIETAVLEENGKISILPKTAARPVTTKDLNLLLTESTFFVTVIVDGKILDKNVKQIGKDNMWIKTELKKQKIDNITDVFYAFYNDKNTLSVYKKTSKAPKNDCFQ